MAQFDFKLEGVLEQRKLVERQRQGELAAAQREVLRIEAELKEAGALAADEAIDLHGRVQAHVILAHARFAEAMRLKILGLTQQLDTARTALGALEASLTEAAKQRKVLEKLREKQEAQWVTRERRREQAASDDVAQGIARSADEMHSAGA